MTVRMHGRMHDCDCDWIEYSLWLRCPWVWYDNGINTSSFIFNGQCCSLLSLVSRVVCKEMQIPRVTLLHSSVQSIEVRQRRELVITIIRIFIRKQRSVQWMVDRTGDCQWLQCNDTLLLLIMIVYFIVIPVSSELPHWHCVSFIDFCTAVRQRDATRWRVALELSFHCLGWNYWIGLDGV